MVGDKIIKFCARIGPRSISLVMKNCPQMGEVEVTWRLNFWHISVNISKMVQDSEIQYLQWKTNRISYMAYQMAATAVTLNDFEGHSPVANLFKCNSSNICAAFYTLSTDSVLPRFLCISRASCFRWHHWGLYAVYCYKDVVGLCVAWSVCLSVICRAACLFVTRLCKVVWIAQKRVSYRRSKWFIFWSKMHRLQHFASHLKIFRGWYPEPL